MKYNLLILLCAAALGNAGRAINNASGGNSDPSQAAAICSAEGSDGVLVAHERCNQFYKCLEGTPVALGCPLDLLYVPQTEQCDWPENVDCGDRTVSGSDSNESGNDNGGSIPGGGNSDPSQASAICAADGSDGVLVAHENCNKFYKCSEGKPVAIACQLNLLFNPANNQCDWPDNVDCGNRVVPT